MNLKEKINEIEYISDPDEEETDEISIINKNIQKNKNSLDDAYDDYQWHCLNFQPNEDSLHNIITKFLNFEI
jgi:hypothetical protein